MKVPLEDVLYVCHMYVSMEKCTKTVRKKKVSRPGCPCLVYTRGGAPA